MDIRHKTTPHGTDVRREHGSSSSASSQPHPALHLEATALSGAGRRSSNHPLDSLHLSDELHEEGAPQPAGQAHSLACSLHDLRTRVSTYPATAAEAHPSLPSRAHAAMPPAEQAEPLGTAPAQGAGQALPVSPAANPSPSTDPTQLTGPPAQTRAHDVTETDDIRDIPASKDIDPARHAQDILAHTSFPAVDPFAATIAQNIDSTLHSPAQATQVARLELPQHFERPVDIHLGLGKGPDAPMMVIFPGTGGDASQDAVVQLESIATQRGMNFAVLPNPWSPTWTQAGPHHMPGTLPTEVQANLDILQSLKAKYPGYFEKVSGVGASYGAMLGAATIRGQQEQAKPGTINGAFVAVSPPANLLDSMHQLSHLGDGAQASAADIARLGTAYLKQVYQHGFEGFDEAAIAQPGDHAAERALAYKLGPQAILQAAVNDLGLAHRGIETLEGYTSQVLERDPWFAEHQTTVQETSEKYRFDRLLDDLSGHGVPVITLTAKDDFILTAQNVATFSAEAAHPNADQAIRQYEHGSHLGLLFDPQLRSAIGLLAAEGAAHP